MVDVRVQAFISVKKEDREYSLVCSNDSKLGEAYDAWREIGDYLVQRISEANQQLQQSQQAPVAVPEAPKEV